MYKQGRNQNFTTLDWELMHINFFFVTLWVHKGIIGIKNIKISFLWTEIVWTAITLSFLKVEE